jgi:hypothetical protein
MAKSRAILVRIDAIIQKVTISITSCLSVCLVIKGKAAGRQLPLRGVIENKKWKNNGLRFCDII